MAGFLRRKFTQESKPNATSNRQVQSSVTTHASAPPPLFARFATTYQDSKPSPAALIVSSPMPLGLTNPTRRKLDPDVEAPNNTRPQGVAIPKVSSEQRSLPDGLPQTALASGRSLSALVTSQSTNSIATTNTAHTPPAHIRHGKLSKSTPRPPSRAILVDKPLPDPHTSDSIGAPHPASSFPPVRHTTDNISPPPRVRPNSHNSTPVTRDDKLLPSSSQQVKSSFRPPLEVEYVTHEALSILESDGENPPTTVLSANPATMSINEAPNVEMTSPSQPIQPAPQQPSLSPPFSTHRVLPRIPQPTYTETSSSSVNPDLQSPPSLSAIHTPLRHDLRPTQSSLSDIDSGPATTIQEKYPPGRTSNIKISRDAMSQTIDDSSGKPPATDRTFPAAFRRGDYLDNEHDASISNTLPHSNLTLSNDQKDSQAPSSGLPSPSNSPKARRSGLKSARPLAPSLGQPTVAVSRSEASQIIEEFRNRSFAPNSQPASRHTPVDGSTMGVSASSLTAHAIHSVSPHSPGPRITNAEKTRNMSAPFIAEKAAEEQDSKALVSHQHRTSMHVRPAQQHQANAPMRGKPLIFAAMATVEQSAGPKPSPPTLSYVRPGERPEVSSRPVQDSTMSRIPKLQPSRKRPSSVTVQPAPREGLQTPSLYPTIVADALGREEVPPQQRSRNQTPAVQPPKKLRSRKAVKSSAPTFDMQSPRAHINSHNGARVSPDPHIQAQRVLTKARPVSPVSPSASPPELRHSLELGHIVDKYGDVPANQSFLQADDVEVVNPGSEDSLPVGTASIKSKVISNVESEAPLSMDVPADRVTVYEMEVDEAVLNVPPTTPAAIINHPPTPPSPDDYRHARAQRRGHMLDKSIPLLVSQEIQKQAEEEEPEPSNPFPLATFLTDTTFLSSLLSYLTFYEWCILSSVSKDIRTMLGDNGNLREEVLERYLRTVGYARWSWGELEPLTLTLQDLNDYMRGVSTPTHQYARVAESYLQSRKGGWTTDDQASTFASAASDLRASSRAYTRVVLRLRAQAETEANALAIATSDPIRVANVPKANGYETPPQSRTSRGSSRAPSPSPSIFARSHHSRSRQSRSHSPNQNQTNSTVRPVVVASGGPTFRSPLFRLQRAPLLRVFVPSPDGDWLSDASVLECEAELRRSGALGMLRAGDIVWDVAVGDEGNVGRMVWDGGYLIDLDYSYSAVGDLPKYIHTLAFPPSYFHRVIRTGLSASNPIVHVDISPWGGEIATNLQLLQERVRTETPQGAYHNVVRWVHRSYFVVQPPPMMAPRSSNQVYSRSRPQYPRIPIPGTGGLFVDAGWYGTIVVETEGTNEGLADLQNRCGLGAFPPRAGSMSGRNKDKDYRKVFRLLREKSQPGEIWIRAVRGL